MPLGADAGDYDSSMTSGYSSSGSSGFGGPGLGSIGLGAMGLGSIMSAYGSYESGVNTEKVDRYNAQLLRLQSDQVLEGGEYQAGVQDTRLSLLAGRQEAGFAGQGVTVGAGTSAAVLASSENVSDQDKMMIRLNARRQAFGMDTQANSLEMQGELARRAGNFGAAASIISGAGSAATLAALM